MIKEDVMVSVKVVWRSSGRPYRGARVAIAFHGLLRGVSRTVSSDADGLAHFDNDPGSGVIHVDGRERYRGSIAGLTVVYV